MDKTRSELMDLVLGISKTYNDGYKMGYEKGKLDGKVEGLKRAEEIFNESIKHKKV